MVSSILSLSSWVVSPQVLNLHTFLPSESQSSSVMDWEWDLEITYRQKLRSSSSRVKRKESFGKSSTGFKMRKMRSDRFTSKKVTVTNNRKEFQTCMQQMVKPSSTL